MEYSKLARITSSYSKLKLHSFCIKILFKVIRGLRRFRGSNDQKSKNNNIFCQKYD